ncbi:MAG: hypothetical protein AAGC43_08975 [Bacteroidota bacterium]
MNKKIGWILFLVMICSCKKSYETKAFPKLSNWEFKMVSRGNNRPGFEIKKDSIHFIPILLHYGHTANNIADRFGWSEEDFDEKIEILTTNGFLKKTTDGFVPSVMIISEKEAKKVREDLKPTANQILNSIVSLKDSLSFKAVSVSCFERFTMDELSLLVFSNILLDNGQLNNIEREYLRAERPKRNKSRYYASYQEKDNPSFEALGIYGNHVQPYSGFMLCRYGNQRYTPEVLEMNAQLHDTYKTLKEGEIFDYPIVTAECQLEIMALADYYKPYVLDILNKNDMLFRKTYRDSSYSKEVSFEEYFMWVYHILYSQVTDMLIRLEHIVIPKEKVSFYVFQP